MKLTMRSWLSFLRRLLPGWETRRNRQRRQRWQTLRSMTLQGLEARQLLSASLQVFNGSTQYSNGSSDSFGTVTVGAPDSQTLTLKNVGDATLTISSDPFPSGFSSTTSAPINIAPQQSLSVSVTMNTNSMGSYSGPWTLSTNDPSNSNFVLNLSGNVQQSSGGGTIELFDGSTQLSNGGSDSFGTVLTGSSETKTFTVQNVGSSALTVNSVNPPSGYTLNGSFPLTVPPNQSSTFSVSIVTSAVADCNGQMLVQSSDTSHNPFTVNLSGTVVRSTTPSITLQDGSTTIANGGSDSFGSVTQGNPDSRTYKVTDWGSNTLTVNTPTLPPGYTTSTTFPLNVTAGNSATFVVNMNTSTLGTVSGQMTLPTNDPNNSTFSVNLSGTVTAPAAPVMSLADGSTTIANGGSDSYGSLTQGANGNKTFTVKNTGSASLTVSAVNPPTGFSLQTAMPLTIAAGSSTTFVVAMSTSTVGSLSGTMSITDTDSNNNPYTVSLSGTVTAPPPAPAMSLADGSTTIANGGSDSFGSVTQGTSDTRTYTVKNTGTASLTVSAVNPPPGFSLQTAMPLTIAAGGSTTFVVAMSTSTVGSQSGTMAITDTDSNNSPYNVSLSGTVTAPPA
ncbi:MAG TPA: choice-of-anchor D domain-containing protein, partial [Pirellulales bacterium]|nr:choice-of-anchor D domain-containing protein [Pirellulales bacterium]